MSERDNGERDRIVVGVDGSAGSRAALRWAARQAELTGAALEAIAAWEYPATYGWAPVPPSGYGLPEGARKGLDDAFAEVFGDEVPEPVTATVTQGHPAQVLVDASAGAALLVVGSRGHGGVADALLGSVSTYCVHHASGPVTVVRPGR